MLAAFTLLFQVIFFVSLENTRLVLSKNSSIFWFHYRPNGKELELEEALFNSH